MLSPCHPNGEKRFVVVELCEDIRIDTVQLANFEFFSGVFKDIRVSAAHTYTNDGKGWTVVGEYTAKNIRGIQSFHPQKELSQFYRYIRIDFLSYYGTEYFCPVSLLRVYGLTQMEEWKSDVWKAEWEASQAAGRINHPSASQKFDIPSNVGHASASDGSVPGATLEDRPAVDSNGSIATTTVSDETSTKGTTTADITDVPIVPEIHQDTSTFVAPLSKEIYVSTKMEPNSVLNDKATLTAAHGSQSTESQDTVAHVDHPSTSTSSVGTEDVSSMESSSMVDTSNASENPSADGTTPQTVTRIVSTTIVLSSATPAASPAVVVSSGESVYRMIINRLANLEANQTLYARYFEEQGKMVNFRLERMEEDIGRLAAVVTSQQRNVAKIIEKHKAEIEYTQEQLVARVDHLAHEVRNPNSEPGGRS
ncbi:hypothetical protein FRC15_003270 [Serendipita sp. 397]|nr:hypothetical protein FRC15_003270 [Serendipita sp. 397]